ncbi:MAG TPA: hypothetical protein ENG63_01520 [Candidatus Desulfofervidus auxilii]|uniref:Uncharacterized protein n=1 Tax=Desulfofervidus auxilii TaxID=1621989 RepID=A0A7C0Y637_DESA2|nr:hypothetical protein [Candidatus Desulfofervidus auxilii]
MFNMELLKKEIEMLEAEIKREADAEYAIKEAAIAREIEMGRLKEEEMIEFLKNLNISKETLEKTNEEVEKISIKALEETERLEGTPDEVLINEIEQLQNMQALGISSIMANVELGIQSHWWGSASPYYCCGSIHKHNEGGITNGGYSCPKYAISSNRMHPWVYAKGDGLFGYTDDNDVTVYNTLYFAYWPTGYEVVRPRAWVSIHGYYGIYSNDKWWNHRWAKVKLDIGIDVYQNYWVGAKWINIKNRSNDNINERGRIDRYTTIEANPLTVGPNKWVIITVTTKLRVESEGRNAWGKLSFRGSDFISASMIAIR